ncbi:hypothetical protein QN382_13710 [Pseudomonas sp. 10B1]|uniref:hypothetical protein n=2 Tax=unclassified Pseudomonas TaxID=196821 RepID=UPI002B239287|nr:MULTISPECIES: hypothetical protein [unclassified Pseudomonas]MEA9979685.1 hypothetical protein [Pseudomonas sp. RTS4]MEA9995317.1 hypothetical protein [Pseudomonas sp. AA4]MEB0087221.1 hypothetical protein [Pseudomonas sp. RTI1]MEB0127423.1 hypothetical protein [Pseudomonas sp. CCC1.2]MEB0153516.1 hypothetical protein [Pseudomonas sp. CCC4.3]
MKGIVLLVSALFLASCSHADNAPSNDLIGNYYLQGVMEMASQLSLQEGDNFEAVVEYGSADGYAKGKWSQDGQRLTLRRNNEGLNGENDISQFFDEMVLVVGDDCLTIEESRGCYVKLPKRQASE